MKHTDDEVLFCLVEDSESKCFNLTWVRAETYHLLFYPTNGTVISCPLESFKYRQEVKRYKSMKQRQIIFKKYNQLMSEV